MRVVYIGSFRLPNYDAAAARVINIARALREAGHEVNFISWGGEERKEDCCEDGIYRIDGFPYMVTNELSLPKMSTIEKLRNKLRRGDTTKRLLLEWPKPVDAIITYCLSRPIGRYFIPYISIRFFLF